MNDQRQVIFSQRTSILKKSNINEMIDTFFEEVSQKFLMLKNDYKTSGDKKFLTKIKVFIGNVINDEQLIILADKDEKGFLSGMKKYITKKELRKLN